MRLTFVLAGLVGLACSGLRAQTPPPRVVSGEVFLAGEIETPPRLKDPRIVYYPPADTSRSATVRVEFIVDTTGQVEPASIKLLEASAPAFNSAAVYTLLSSHYTPGRTNHVKVRTLVSKVLEFPGHPKRCGLVDSIAHLACGGS